MRVDGVLLLDKPSGLSSNAALQRVRRLFGADRAGHTGTLDPLASGMLPVVFGDAAKFGQGLLDADKEYLVSIRLGLRTSTGDAEGEVLEALPVPEFTAAQVEAAMARLRGPIEQVPPMYSALKRDGRPLYAYARRGQTVEREPRPVRIERFELTGRSAVLLEAAVRCSKGTYVRTLAEDLGRLLGCGAHVAALRRVGIGRHRIGECVALEALEQPGLPAGPGRQAWLQARLLPIDTLVEGLPRLDLDAAAVRALIEGRQPLAPDAGGGQGPGLWRAYGPGGRFLGLVEAAGQQLRSRRLVRTEGWEADRAPEAGPD
jgi:tRNA pseudouridine55 synthase